MPSVEDDEDVASSVVVASDIVPELDVEPNVDDPALLVDAEVSVVLKDPEVPDVVEDVPEPLEAVAPVELEPSVPASLVSVAPEAPSARAACSKQPASIVRSKTRVSGMWRRMGPV
jgi:hypothetical protein